MSEDLIAGDKGANHLTQDSQKAPSLDLACVRPNMNNSAQSIPIPRGGFKTNGDDARWLEETILLRTGELLRRAGVTRPIAPSGLYEMLLIALNDASERGKKQISSGTLLAGFSHPPDCNRTPCVGSIIARADRLGMAACGLAGCKHNWNPTHGGCGRDC